MPYLRHANPEATIPVANGGPPEDRSSDGGLYFGQSGGSPALIQAW